MGTSTPLITIEGSPISRVLHPKTNVSTGDAARKHAADKYMDKRSPVMSPKVRTLPEIKYDSLRSPIVERKFSVKQLSPVQEPAQEATHSADARLASPIHKQLSPVESSPSIKIEDKTRASIKSQPTHKNETGSLYYYSPVKSSPVQSPIRSTREASSSTQQHKKSLRVSKQEDGYYVVVDQDYEVEYVYEETYDQQEYSAQRGKTTEDLMRETYESMTELEQAKAIWSMCSEIKRLAEQHPHLQLGLMPDDGSVGIMEIHSYLLFIRERISQEEKMNVLDLAMNSIYTFCAWALEKFLDVPMKGYFDSLRATIGDYRTLIMDNTDVSKFINSTIPSVSAPQTSLVAIMTMFFGQVLAGCAVAIGAKWWGGGGRMSELAATTASAGASRVNSHLNDYMFKGGSFFGTIGAIGRSVFGGGKPPTNPVDV